MLHSVPDSGEAKGETLSSSNSEVSSGRMKKIARGIGGNMAKGFLFALGATLPLAGTGVYLINHFNDTVVDPAKQKVDENGKSLREGLDSNANGLGYINKNGVRVEVTIPGTGPDTVPSQPQVTLAPSSENAIAAPSTSTSESTTTTEPPTMQTVTTLPPDPQGDAAP